MDDRTNIYHSPFSGEEEFNELPMQEDESSFQDDFESYEMHPEDEPYDEIEDEVSAAQEGGRHFRAAMNVFDTVSVLVGVVVILILTMLLISLVSWLYRDIVHSFTLLQSGIQ